MQTQAVLLCGHRMELLRWEDLANIFCLHLRPGCCTEFLDSDP